jgi:hypothetical protein
VGKSIPQQSGRAIRGFGIAEKAPAILLRTTTIPNAIAKPLSNKKTLLSVLKAKSHHKSGS